MDGGRGWRWLGGWEAKVGLFVGCCILLSIRESAFDLNYWWALYSLWCRTDLELQPQGRCDILELPGPPTPEQMTLFVNSHRPIIWRGGVKALGLDRVKWSYENLLKKYGVFWG